MLLEANKLNSGELLKTYLVPTSFETENEETGQDTEGNDLL